ncbi:MAG: chemotaxis protein MotB [Bdellovibrionales bacterium]|nr:chemotaxis protein MotB [Bdellovibrionales bacterium]
MAEKEPTIVIKKINVVAGGGHGGSWKVAFADFMTALMAFFLCMWLLAQSEDVKKEVSDYFSTPSVIEYNFSNYGVELTLEKLFLDLINEPLKIFKDFITPADSTPNFLRMGSKKIVMYQLAEELGDIASNVEVNPNEIVIEIPSEQLFRGDTAITTTRFRLIMEKIHGITTGLEDADVFIDSNIFYHSIQGGKTQAINVGEQRLDYIINQIESQLEHETVDLFGKVNTEKGERGKDKSTIKFRIKQKERLSDGTKARSLQDAFGDSDESMSVYDSFVKQVSEKKAKKIKQ